MPDMDIQMLETYFRRYLDSYREYISSQERKPQDPLFFREYPIRVDVYVLPNRGVAAFFYGHAQETTVNVQEGSAQDVKAKLSSGDYSRVRIYYPSKNFSEQDAEADGKNDAVRDLRYTIYKAGLSVARGHASELLSAMDSLKQSNPWLESSLNEIVEGLRKIKSPLDKLGDEYDKLDRGDVKMIDYMIDDVSLIDIQSPATPDDDAVKAYMEAYHRGYLATVSPDLPENAKPPYARNQPVRFRIAVLPNNSVAVLISHGALMESFEVTHQDYTAFRSEMDAKGHDALLLFPPLKVWDVNMARRHGSLDAKRDIRYSLHLALLEKSHTTLGKYKKKIEDLKSTNPWLEDSLSKLSAKIESLEKILDVIKGEIASSFLKQKYSEQVAAYSSVCRYLMPVVETPPAPEPAPAPQQEEVQQVQQVYVQQGMTEEERQILYELRNTVFLLNKKVEEFERKLAYMDQYVENHVQRRQDEKFAQQDLYIQSNLKKVSAVSYALTGIAVVLSIIALLVNYRTILDLISSLGG